MGMCAFTCCTPCWCAAGFGTATAPLCCCKNRCGAANQTQSATPSDCQAVPRTHSARDRYLDSNAGRLQVAGGALASALGLALYIAIRVGCMEDGDCTTDCPSAPAEWLGDGPPPPMPSMDANNTGWQLTSCTTTCQDASFKLWSGGASASVAYLFLPFFRVSIPAAAASPKYCGSAFHVDMAFWRCWIHAHACRGVRLVEQRRGIPVSGRSRRAPARAGFSTPHRGADVRAISAARPEGPRICAVDGRPGLSGCDGPRRCSMRQYHPGIGQWPVDDGDGA
jgi:hypothetical protein